jgi:hypothetical protein
MTRDDIIRIAKQTIHDEIVDKLSIEIKPDNSFLPNYRQLIVKFDNTVISTQWFDIEEEKLIKY